jgi:hypothetical protein
MCVHFFGTPGTVHHGTSEHIQECAFQKNSQDILKYLLTGGSKTYHYIQTFPVRKGNQIPGPIYSKYWSGEYLTPVARRETLLMWNSLNYRIKLALVCVNCVYCTRFLCVCVCVRACVHQSRVSGCHGNVFECKYGQHALCDNCYRTLLEEGIPFCAFAFYVAGKAFVYIHDQPLYYILSNSQF